MKKIFTLLLLFLSAPSQAAVTEVDGYTDLGTLRQVGVTRDGRFKVMTDTTTAQPVTFSSSTVLAVTPSTGSRWNTTGSTNTVAPQAGFLWNVSGSTVTVSPEDESLWNTTGSTITASPEDGSLWNTTGSTITASPEDGSLWNTTGSTVTVAPAPGAKWDITGATITASLTISSPTASITVYPAEGPILVSTTIAIPANVSYQVLSASSKRKGTLICNRSTPDIFIDGAAATADSFTLQQDDCTSPDGADTAFTGDLFTFSTSAASVRIVYLEPAP